MKPLIRNESPSECSQGILPPQFEDPEPHWKEEKGPQQSEDGVESVVVAEVDGAHGRSPGQAGR